jgi:signal transduction histidine kinase
MVRVLEAQQLTLVTRVADEIDDKLALRLDALARLARTLPAQEVGNGAAMQDILENRPGIHGLFDSLSVTNMQGASVATFPSNQRIRSVNFADRQWFKEALAADGPRVALPVLSRLSGTPVVIIAAPVRNRDGITVGVLSGTLDLYKTNFLGRIGASRVGQTGSFALFARDRTVIMSGDPARVLKPGPAAGASAAFDAVIGTYQGAAFNSTPGELQGVVSHHALDAAPWVLTATLPLDEALGPVREAERNMLFALLVVALVSVPAIWLTMRLMLSPLTRLRGALRDLRADPHASALPATLNRQDAGGEVAELTAEFNALLDERARAEAQLRDRTAALETSNRELDAFCHSVAHDMRSPLRHIAGYANEIRMLEEERMGADARMMLGRVIASAQLQGEMIDGLLDYASLQQRHLQLVPVELDHLLHALIEDAKAGGEAKPGTVWRIGALPAVRGDDVLLRHLFSNLIGNAVKYSAKREQPEIDIGWQPHGEHQARIYVRDNGAGFEMQYAHRLFGMFERLHSKAEFAGTGIGLALVRRIAERLGGAVEAAGEVGKGATFTVVLNLA